MPTNLPRFAIVLIGLVLVLVTVQTSPADVTKGNILLSDDFERTESQEVRDEVGNGWTTNSKSRAAGNKQVDLVDGAMHIVRHEVADHGVSVVQDLQFKNALISMRFKLGPGDDLGINIADMKEKSVHAGHICMAQIRNGNLQMKDLKRGPMNLVLREARKAGTLTKDQKRQIDACLKKVPVNITPNQWHTLSVKIDEDTMTVRIDQEVVGTFQSPGVGHPTKNRLRLAVNKSAWVDDVQVVDLD